MTRSIINTIALMRCACSPDEVEMSTPNESKSMQNPAIIAIITKIPWKISFKEVNLNMKNLRIFLKWILKSFTQGVLLFESLKQNNFFDNRLNYS